MNLKKRKRYFSQNVCKKASFVYLLTLFPDQHQMTFKMRETFFRQKLFFVKKAAFDEKQNFDEKIF